MKIGTITRRLDSDFDDLTTVRHIKESAFEILICDVLNNSLEVPVEIPNTLAKDQTFGSDKSQASASLQ